MFLDLYEAIKISFRNLRFMISVVAMKIEFHTTIS